VILIFCVAKDGLLPKLLLLGIDVDCVEWLKVLELVVTMLLTLSARLLFRGLGRTGV